MGLKNLFLAVDVSFLQPLVDFLNDWYVNIILVLIAVGIIYAVVLGVNLAKSDNSETRERMKKRIVNASLTIVIVVVLTFGLNFVLSNLNKWVNGGYPVEVANYTTSAQFKIGNGEYKDLVWDDNFKCFRAEIGNEAGEFSVKFTEENDVIKFASETITEFGDVQTPEKITINNDSPKSGKVFVPIYKQDGSGIYNYYEIQWSRTI